MRHFREIHEQGLESQIAQIVDGKAKLEGNNKVLNQLASTLVHFELGFEILTGTKGKSSKPKRNPFEQGPVQLKGE